MKSRFGSRRSYCRRRSLVKRRSPPLAELKWVWVNRGAANRLSIARGCYRSALLAAARQRACRDAGRVCVGTRHHPLPSVAVGIERCMVAAMASLRRGESRSAAACGSNRGRSRRWHDDRSSDCAAMKTRCQRGAALVIAMVIAALAATVAMSLAANQQQWFASMGLVSLSAHHAALQPAGNRQVR